MPLSPDTLGIDLLELRDWLLHHLAQIGEVRPSILSVLAGITQGKNGCYFDPEAARAYRVQHSRAKVAALPNRAQISDANRLLLAPACFAWGETTHRWMIPVKRPEQNGGAWPITPAVFPAPRLSEFAKLKSRVGDNNHEGFLEAWVRRKRVAKVLGLLRPEPTLAREQLRRETQELYLNCTRIFGKLAQCVSDQTHVLLIAHGDLAQDSIESSATQWHGELLPYVGNSHAIWFQSDKRYILPAIRAMLTAHEILSAPLQPSQDSETSDSSRRVLILKSPNQLVDAKQLAAVAGAQLKHESLGDVSGEVYLDSYLWTTLGNWANAKRHPPTPISALSDLGRRWARLDDFGTSREPFRESTIKPDNLVCRQEQQSQLNQAWLDVSTGSGPNQYRRAQIVEIVGPDGSGKRSLLDVFFQHRVFEDATTAVPLRFTHAGPCHPFRPFIDMIRQVFDMSPSSGYFERLEALQEELQGMNSRVSSASINNIHSSQGLEQTSHVNNKEAISPSSIHRRQVRIERALRSLVREAMISAASKNPLVIAAFDLHRATEESRRLFLDLCQDVYDTMQIGELPILIVCTSRQGVQHEPGQDREFITARILLESLTRRQYKRLVDQYRRDGIDFCDDEVEAYWEEGPVMPGRFVTRMVLPGGMDTRSQQCKASLTQILRPHATQASSDFTTLHERSVGVLALMSLLGESADPNVLTTLLMSHPDVKSAISKRNQEKHQESLQHLIKEHLRHAMSSGVLDIASGDASHFSHFRFRDPINAIWLRHRIRRRIAEDPEGRKLARQLAFMLVSEGNDSSMRQWESAASLIQFTAYEDGLCCEYWTKAGEATLRQGDPKGAQRRYKRAYDVSLWPTRNGRPSQEKWETVLEAYRCYLYAIRFQNVTPNPEAEERFKEYIKKSGILDHFSKSEFNARLCQWHLADIRGDHRRASRRVKLIRRAIERAEQLGKTQISTQQHRELAYTAWATAISRGNFLAASRYYGQLFTLGVLAHDEESAEMTLSSGHDLEFYAPARHAVVHWLTGDFSGVHELKRMLLSRLRHLPPEDVFRKFWASAYFIPVAIFLGWAEVVDQFMHYIQDPACTRIGGTMKGIAMLLGQMKQVPSIQETQRLRDILVSLGYAGPMQPDRDRSTKQQRITDVQGMAESIGHKHRSAWVCLVARRWIEVGDRNDLPPLVAVLDQMITDCTSREERFMLAELYRLRALAHRQNKELGECRALLDRSIEIAAVQGAVTLEIEAQQNKLTVTPEINERQDIKGRLAWLFRHCDFPIDHPVAKSIKLSLGKE